MQEYYFLFGLAFIWIVFAVVQDLRTREIANWLNFSLIAFVLAYRAFYAVFSEDVMFFVYGVIGVLLFVALGYLFYYGRIFAGGDAKLLMGLGGIFPYQSFFDYFYFGVGFIFILFLAGAVWTLIYSLFLIRENMENFFVAFKKEFRSNIKLLYFSIFLVLILVILLFNYGFGYLLWLLLFLVLMPLIYIYVKAIEESCMIKLKNPRKLTVGDWLEKEVKVGNKVIKKSVHGLSEKDIKLLRKVKKKVWIKEGVPFTPAFLIALLMMVVFLRYFSL